LVHINGSDQLICLSGVAGRLAGNTTKRRYP
jgi:hypothetical protein